MCPWWVERTGDTALVAFSTLVFVFVTLWVYSLSLSESLSLCCLCIFFFFLVYSKLILRSLFHSQS